MKEATGELNATIVVVMAITVLIAFFYYAIWPLIKENFDKNTQCSKAICEKDNDNDGYVTCHKKNDNKTFTCVFKG